MHPNCACIQDVHTYSGQRLYFVDYTKVKKSSVIFLKFLNFAQLFCHFCPIRQWNNRSEVNKTDPDHHGHPVHILNSWMSYSENCVSRVMMVFAFLGLFPSRWPRHPRCVQEPSRILLVHRRGHRGLPHAGGRALQGHQPRSLRRGVGLLRVRHQTRDETH